MAPVLLEGSLYDFTLSTPQSKPWSLGELKGTAKAVLLVNTASECGYTPQIGPLGDLYKEYKDRGLVVIGVPSNDFGSQEPLASDQIPAFCETNFGASFPLSAKVMQPYLKSINCVAHTDITCLLNSHFCNIAKLFSSRIVAHFRASTHQLTI